MFVLKPRPTPHAAVSMRQTWDPRPVATGALALLGLAFWATTTLAEETTVSHGYSFFGNLDYAADFPHLDYVNPDAPKGGEFSMGATGTFDSMNPYSRKGRSGGLTGLLYDRVLQSPDDTVGQYYCVLCESIEYPDNRDWVIFNMRKDVTFSDGTPVTAHDFVYSHKLFITQGLPSYAAAVSRMVTSAEALDDYTAKFTFNPEESRRSLIETVGSTVVFSKAWFEADPENRRLDEPRLEVAVGSGPYTLESYDINRQIVYTRRDDYWGTDHPYNRGRNNYDTVKLEYFADQTASFEAFKAGEYTFRTETDPKQWATSYNFPRVTDGIVKLEELPDGSPPTPEGFVFNLAKPQVQDKTVREAIALAFNFEWTNESLLYGLYTQHSSFSEGTHIQAHDVPKGAELEFLQSLETDVPDDLLNEPVRVSHTSKPERLADRRNLRKASKMLEGAGWTVGDDGVRRNAAGETLSLNFLLPSNIPSSVEGMHDTFVQNLQQIGVDAAFEKVDPSQYTLRRRERDYDMIWTTRYSPLLSTGGGLLQMYGSEEAAFSLFNPAGLASALVDDIINTSFLTTDQDATDVALMALDRAMRHEFFIIPTGHIADYWVSSYDMYEHPETLPPYGLGQLDFWWINPEKEAKLKAEGVLN